MAYTLNVQNVWPHVRDEVNSDTSRAMIHADLARVLVTSASRGLGIAFVGTLVEREYRWFFGARSGQELQARAVCYAVVARIVDY